MLNGHNVVLGENTFGVVVDQLPVDEDVDAVVHDFHAFVLHLLLFGGLDGGDVVHGRNPYAGAVDLNLVGVHGRVRNQDLCVFDSLRLSYANLFIQKETVFQVGMDQGTSGLLDDLNQVQVCASF